ncbi:MAG: UDP-N-acetylmuramate dehydrogenase [Bacteroidales bacterium]
MKPRENVPLKELNTFGVDARARYLLDIDTCENLAGCLEGYYSGNLPLLILGGGSNILFTGDYHGWIVLVNTKGIGILKEDSSHVWVRAEAGEVWDDLVEYALARGYGGLENLICIPGKVGASPIQNIGAYGVEMKDRFHSLQAYDLHEKKIRTFLKEDCRFGYRDSIFKRELQGRFLITSVVFKLDKHPRVHTSYGIVAEQLRENKVSDPGIRDVAEAIAAIRSRKLPDPDDLGNAGSFFKNPVISGGVYARLKLQYPDIPGYRLPAGDVKIPAAWLIDRCGFKGFRKGEAGVHEFQPLVLVNHGKATGRDILALGDSIRSAVWERFGIRLDREVWVV